MKRGFTLVELSIVLVIIGLLIGGILAAQSMINTAKITKQIKQIEEIQIAIRNFKTKYNTVPGDSAVLSSAGNGDGQTNSGATGSTQYQSWDWYDATYEWLAVFNQLAISGTYDFKPYTVGVISTLPGTAYPKMILNNKKTSTNPNGYDGGVVFGYESGAYYMKSAHKLHIGACPGFPSGINAVSGHLSFGCGLLPIDAAALDAKIDDGNPYSGNMVATGYVYVDLIPPSGSDGTNGCGNYPTNTYQTNTTNNCSIELNTDF